MKKQYRLLIETLEHPKGTIATLHGLSQRYNIMDPDTHTLYVSLASWQVEDRPTVWELINQEPVEEKVKNEYLPFIPEKLEMYWYIDGLGEISNDNNYLNDIYSHENAIKQGVFCTEKSAKYEALRRESMSKRYKPEYEEEYFYYRFTERDINNVEWRKDIVDIPNFFIGNVHRTKKEAEQWAYKYAEAWRVLL